MTEEEFLNTYRRARHIVSYYEIIHGKSARWYWDPAYVTEAQQALLEEYLWGLPPEVQENVAQEIDASLTWRYQRWQVWQYWKGVWYDLDSRRGTRIGQEHAHSDAHQDDPLCFAPH